MKMLLIWCYVGESLVSAARQRGLSYSNVHASGRTMTDVIM